jgi:nuclear GTP-binding protein
MCKIYKLPTQNSTLSFPQFLVQLALMSGRLLKSGVADIESAARTVLQDWNSHKIPFHSEAPTVYTSKFPGQRFEEKDERNSKVISSGLAPAFTLDGLLDHGPCVGNERYI